MQDEIKIGNDIGEICQNFQNYILNKIEQAKRQTVMDVLVDLAFTDWSLCNDLNAGKEITARDMFDNFRDAFSRIQMKYNISDCDLTEAMGFMPTPYQSTEDLY